MENIYKYLVKYDEKWCNIMGFFNPYTDPFDVMFSKKIPMFDRQAFNMYPKYNFVYDKLWVCQSQNINCGTIESIDKFTEINYPIFIKPRWGHLSSSSKNCFKINSYNELKKYKKLKQMMWSEYIQGQEYMTDYLMVDGKIIYEISYSYSEKQTGYIEVWKYISPKNKSINTVTKWVTKNMSGYTGIVNVQCRNDSIIEVGLRMARGGAYIQSTDNDNIIKLINSVYNEDYNNIMNKKKLNFKPYYAFKSYTQFPFFYIFPQYIIDFLTYSFDCKDFYEYYFEPNGNKGMVFFQFLHDNYDKGKRFNTFITSLLILMQIILIIIFFYIIYSFFIKNKINYIAIFLFIIIYLTQYLNPIAVQYNWYKAIKQRCLS
tara:strand:+ start:577 stop:1698 length:1122 start_codon:yes stop_codon:yes gene_type:complete